MTKPVVVFHFNNYIRECFALPRYEKDMKDRYDCVLPYFTCYSWVDGPSPPQEAYERRDQNTAAYAGSCTQVIAGT